MFKLGNIGFLQKLFGKKYTIIIIGDSNYTVTDEALIDFEKKFGESGVYVTNFPVKIVKF